MKYGSRIREGESLMASQSIYPRLRAAMAVAQTHSCKETQAVQGLCLMASDSVWPVEVKACE